MLFFIGLLGGLLSLLANIPYIIDTYRNETKPHRVTWGIFFLLNIIFLANQLAAGAEGSIWLVVAFAITTGTIFVLSLKNGVGGTTRTDTIILIGSLLGVVVWQLLDAPVASITANLLVAAIASIPTYRKSWTNPETETKVSYLLGAIAAAMATISVGEIDYVLLLLPVYSFVYEGSIYLILVRDKLKSF